MPFFRFGQGRSAMQIPLGSNVESPVRNQPPTSRCDNSSSSLKGPIMVSSTTVPAVRLSSSNSFINMSHTISAVNSTPFKPQEVQLAIWPTSGNTANRKVFRTSYRTSHRILVTKVHQILQLILS